jgi:hypothetical protein
MNDKETTSELLIAKEKAQAIIESCVTCDHFTTVIPYIELFYKQFGDEDAYKELLKLYDDRFNELQCKKY